RTEMSVDTAAAGYRRGSLADTAAVGRKKAFLVGNGRAAAVAYHADRIAGSDTSDRRSCQPRLRRSPPPGGGSNAGRAPGLEPQQSGRAPEQPRSTLFFSSCFASLAATFRNS